MQDQFAAAGERCNQRTESEIVTERTEGAENGALQPPIARHRSGCGEQRVVAVHNALRLAGRAGGEGQIHHLVSIPAPLGFECRPWQFSEWHSAGRADAPGATYEVAARQFPEDVASVGIGAVGGLGDQRRAAHALGKRYDLANSVIAVQRRAANIAVARTRE